MPASTQTLATIRTDVRYRLDETTARMWSDAELNNWINEACRDISRRTETLLSFYTAITALPNVAKYRLPENVIRVNRVEFQPVNSTETYPLQASTYQEMDAMWGTRQAVQRSYPSFFVLWGVAGSVEGITMQLYPIPSQAGTLNIYYYRLPTAMTADSDHADIPAGWEDLISLYCEYIALRKDRDARWSDAKQMYEENLGHMIDVTRQLHDQARSVTVGNAAVPAWLYEFDW